MPPLHVTLCQTDLVWEDPIANRAAFDKLLGSAAKTDLIMLPEMFTSGFSMAPERIAEPPAGETLAWLQQLAKARDCAITGSIAVREIDSAGVPQFRNRMLFVTPESVSYYDKRHLFILSGEGDHYTPGNQRVVVNWRGWRLCLQVCYDLRFPVWTRNRGDFDALIFIASWPDKRSAHWRSLLLARAIENQCAVIGVNRVGQDGNGLNYVGDSLLIAADGTLLVDAAAGEGLFCGELDGAHQQVYREKLPFHRDADSFTLAQ
jgi:omega-amidase